MWPAKLSRPTISMTADPEEISEWLSVSVVRSEKGRRSIPHSLGEKYSLVKVGRIVRLEGRNVKAGRPRRSSLTLSPMWQ